MGSINKWTDNQKVLFGLLIFLLLLLILAAWHGFWPFIITLVAIIAAGTFGAIERDW
jgi:hypothetical protein